MEITPFIPKYDTSIPKTKKDALMQKAYNYSIDAIVKAHTIEEKLHYRKLSEDKKIEAVLSFDVIDENNIIDALGLVDSHRRWEAFEAICKKYELSPKAYNEGLKDAWTTGLSTGLAIPYFLKADGKLMMDEEELEYYNNLPDEVTLYRGCSANELDRDEENCLGISWTTSRKIAEFFAFRHSDYDDEDRVVVSITVPKSDIITFIKDEDECIYLGAFELDEDDIEIVTEEPTQLYYDYMEEKDNLLK